MGDVVDLKQFRKQRKAPQSEEQLVRSVEEPLLGAKDGSDRVEHIAGRKLRPLLAPADRHPGVVPEAYRQANTICRKCGAPVKVILHAYACDDCGHSMSFAVQFDTVDTR